MRRVTSAIQAVDGVKSVNVSLAEKRAVVTYDPARVKPAAFVAAIEGAGYGAGEPAPVTP